MRTRRSGRRGRHRHESHDSAERWAVSYADLVTLLFAFFTTLYAMSTVDKTKVDALEDSVRGAFAHRQAVASTTMTISEPAQCDAAAPPDPTTKLTVTSHVPGPKWTPAERAARRRLSDLLERMRRDPALRERVEFSPDPRGVRLTLGAAAFFEAGDSRIRSEAGAAMAVLGATLGRHRGGIVVEGHTDDTPVRGGPFRSNWELSTARATEVVALLVETHHVAAHHLSAAGYADHRPVADNRTSAGRARNRRVDIVVLASANNPDQTKNGREL